MPNSRSTFDTRERKPRFAFEILTRFIPAILLLLLPVLAKSQTTAPTPPSTEDALYKDIDAAHQQFKAAVTQPTDLSDAEHRAAIAPKAIPPLKRMVADYQQLAKQEPKMARRAWQIAQQFNAFLATLGDKDTIAQLRDSAESPDLETACNARSSQLLAQWVTAGKNQTAQSQLAEQLKIMDQDHPASEAFTFLTVTLSQSAVSPTLQKTLLQEAREMQNPIASNLRRLTPTTKP